MVSAAVHSDDGSVDNGSVVDYKGNPVDKSKTGRWLGAGLILGCELSERICEMGIGMNLVTYLVGNLHLPTSQSATMVTNFLGTLNLLALLAGFIADAKLGRYLTVAIFATIAAMGASLLTLATSLSKFRPPECDTVRIQHHECIQANGKQLAMLLAALYTIALGCGGIKANVSGFSSDQFDTQEPKEARAMTFFFSRFYFCISFGSIFATTVLVYVQDNVGRGWGYGICASAVVIAVSVLIAGTPLYRFRKPQGSPFTLILRVMYLAWKKRRLAYPMDSSELNEYHTAKVAHTQRFRCLDKAAIVEKQITDNYDEVGNYTTSKSTSACTVTEVEEVKMVVKLLPIWSTCILFWTVYSQMTTFSVEQATYTNRLIGKSFEFPSGSLSFFLFFSILIFTSLNQKVLVPIARKFTGNVQGITSLQRVSVGLVVSTFAMVVSALIEIKRKNAAVQHGTKISVFWLVPQYFMVGMGEAFAYVGQLEFFIREAPDRMKSMSTGLFLTTLSMGFFFSSLLVSLVDKATNKTWIRNNLNAGRLEYFYFLLAVLSVINFVVFVVFARKHEYKVQNYNINGEQAKEIEC